ncbi:MAG TPA: hypothetical protein VMC83_31460 [Streptosporangiaceae bacterium]|nr:hypothetical protein [Streptosporangiaceae bacterium]
MASRTAPTVDPGPDHVTIEAHTLTSGGVVREYLLAQPMKIPDGPVPLVLDLHGSGFDAADQLRVSRSHRFAADGAVVVAPQGHIPFRLFEGWPRGYAWNVPGSPLPGEAEPRQGPDDVRFLSHLLGALLSGRGATVPIDPGRIHVVGYSGGARLASHLPAALPWLASVACVAGLRYPVPVTGSTVAILAVHGADDPINPYLGKAGSRWSASVEESALHWAVASGWAGETTTEDLGHGVVERCFVPSSSGAPVRLVTVPGIGHAWPGSSDPEHVGRFGPPGRFDASAHLQRLIGSVGGPSPD